MNTKEKIFTKGVTVNLNMEQYAKLAEFAREMGVTISCALRVIVLEKLDEEK